MPKISATPISDINHLAIVTGCRRGELVVLQWNCIDLEKRSISITQSKYKLKEEEIKTKTTKTKGSIRNVAIPQYYVNILRTYKSKQSAKRITLEEIWNDGGWIFTQWNGEPIHTDTPTRWFKKFQGRHGEYRSDTFMRYGTRMSSSRQKKKLLQKQKSQTTV